MKRKSDMDRKIINKIINANWNRHMLKGRLLPKLVGILVAVMVMLLAPMPASPGWGQADALASGSERSSVGCRHWCPIRQSMD
ncbi:hypothetical protein [Nostoc sp. ChiQUE01b]|uniref:hypothetical protein n=1 Tax=Nostoc sp. ChiQUE01b TaxID=3075376 RepID=UPI002AD2029A|nr:hypothetical protein [Nostoc sp. ChiQUE01b]